METSLSIHPDRFGQAERSEYRSPGGVRNFAETPGGADIACDRGALYIRFYGEDIVRIAFDPKGGPLPAHSHAVSVFPPLVEASLDRAEDALTLRGGKLAVRVEPASARVTLLDAATGGTLLAEPEGGGLLYTEKGEVVCRKSSAPDDRYYGFGEKAGFLDKRGEKLVMWNTDVYAPHNPETDSLYVSIPYYMAVSGSQAYGILLDNAHRTEFDMKSRSEIRFGADGGVLDYYFLAGPEPKDVLGRLARLTGTMPLPPKWSLGYHQSRYSYETEAEVRELVAAFEEKGIPLDAVYLDIHYMDGYRVFTVDRSRFPDFEEMVRDLARKGVRVVTIVDPGVKADPEYAVYMEGIRGGMFCKNAEGRVFHGPVWPGRSAFPDFTSGRVRKWWGDNHKPLLDAGVAGIWNDMNEPSVFNESKTMDLDVLHDNDGHGGTHRQLHNAYGLQMARATYEGLAQGLGGDRPFVLTRAGYAGIQKYAAVWTGDNRSFWEHLQMMIPMCLNLGLSGVPFCGADVGGFAHDATAELLVRWTQAAAFTPYFRNHSEIKCGRQEPWAFGEETEALVREAIRMRYRWLLHLYALMEEASRTGVPAMRPLFLEFPDDPETYAIADQFLLGPNVLVAPMLRPGAKHRAVYLPEGEWIEFASGRRCEGGGAVVARAGLDEIPVYVRAGTAVLQESDRLTTAEAAETMTVRLYLSSEAEQAFEYRIYEDDGKTFNYTEGASYEALGSVSLSGGKLEIAERIVRSGWMPAWKKRRVEVYAPFEIGEIRFGGRPVAAATAEAPESGSESAAAPGFGSGSAVGATFVSGSFSPSESASASAPGTDRKARSASAFREVVIFFEWDV
ncbi:TIM-barrel domain-containing protein [Cohnella algarum]|uniref:glycoside hydrolase family 31 protein n=1 Tax=Cohnella algarum TaxID=2044859 RepID=UPI001966E84D|nr:TIM-barrel domain-containing protein [Cohnella algarum]MBN2982421.1 DUF4968 domain-containing protein [Cohnella algarum]